MRHFPYKGKAVISQTYLNPNEFYTSGYHLGVDLVGQDDKNIWSINEGEVILAKHERAFGNTVIVKMVDNLYARYSHLAKITTSVGQRVIGGHTLIGVEGRTGSVYGGPDPRHLDLRISRKPYHTNHVADYISPAEYLGFPNKLNALIVGGETDMQLDHAVLMYTLADLSGAWGQSLKYGKCAMFCRDGKPDVPEDAMNARHLVVVGGPDVNHPNRTYLSGSNMAGTLIKAGEDMLKPPS